jgi:hypothetical protein
MFRENLNCGRYKSLVRPSFEYACSVWDPYTTEENTTRLEQVQRRAARYVTNRYHNTSNVMRVSACSVRI